MIDALLIPAITGFAMAGMGLAYWYGRGTQAERDRDVAERMLYRIIQDHRLGRTIFLDADIRYADDHLTRTLRRSRIEEEHRQMEEALGR